MTIYLQYHDILYIDATGSLIKKIQLPNGELSPHIYLYQAVTNTQNYKMPVFQMLSAVQHVNAIQGWLSEFLRVGLFRKAGFPIPRTVVCDFDMALLNAIAKAFGQHSNLKKYLINCFALILKEHNVEIPKCFIRLDICHYMNMVSKWQFFSQLNPKVKNFYIRAMALLTKQTDFSLFVDLARCILTLSLSEEIGKDCDGNNSAAESARIFITNRIKGIEDVLVNEIDKDTQMDKTDKNIENEEFDIEIGDCNISSWSSNLVQECRKKLAESKIIYDMANPYYVPQLSQKLKTFLSYFPLYSGVMIPIFGYGRINASSSAVESEMNDIKNILLKNKSGSMRADKFVATHLNSFAGRALLSMATQRETLLSPKNNEQMIENSTKSIPSNEVQIIIPSTSETNRFGNNSPIMLEKPKFKINIDSETCIKTECFNLDKSDSISDDTSELNLEHN